VPVSEPLVIWRIADGKSGHDSQSLGLVRALSDRIPTRVVDRDACSAAAAVRGFLQPEPSSSEPPALIVGAGNRTHLPMLALRRAHGGRAVVLMRPTLPIALFDLCLIPEHDAPRARDNVIATMGVVNPLRPSPSSDSTRGLILIGGPSRHHGWDEAALLGQVRDVTAAEPRRNWTIADSRRTPPNTGRELEALAREHVSFTSHRTCPGDWLLHALPRVDEVWVSEDSMSMIYQALSVNAKVGLLSVPAKRESRIIRGLARLTEEAWIMPFTEWRKVGRLRRPPRRLAEADRCAALIHARWFEHIPAAVVET